MSFISPPKVLPLPWGAGPISSPTSKPQPITHKRTTMPTLILSVLLLNAVAQTNPAYDFCPSQYCFAPPPNVYQPAPTEPFELSVLLAPVTTTQPIAAPAAANGNCVNGQCFLPSRITPPTPNGRANFEPSSQSPTGNACDPNRPFMQTSPSRPPATYAAPMRPLTRFRSWLSRLRNRTCRR